MFNFFKKAAAPVLTAEQKEIESAAGAARMFKSTQNGMEVDRYVDMRIHGMAENARNNFLKGFYAEWFKINK